MGRPSRDSSISVKKLSDLTPDKRNANKGSARGNAMIQKSLAELGAGRSILLDKHGAIIAGNKTAENFGALGNQDVLVVQTDGTRLVAVQRMDLDLADPKAIQLAIADNRAGQVSLDWDVDVLRELGGEVDLADFWSKDELADLWPVTLVTDEDDVPPVPAEPVTKRGDLYILGEHRLLCGDSTVQADVERLMDGQKADMVFTDPPYGVDYGGGHAVKGKRREKLANDATPDIYADALPVAFMVSRDEAPLYLWFSDSKSAAVTAAVTAAGYEIRNTLIWNKNLAQFGAIGAQYKSKHEPFLYCFKKGSPPFWQGPNNEVSVWDIGRGQKNEFHPTQKPVTLAERAIGNSCPALGGVLDLFGGSGSTLIACEKTRRKCFMMELSDAYCDVIVTRWQNATGGKAVLHGRAAQKA